MAAGPLQIAKRVLVTLLIALAQQYGVRLVLLVSNSHAFERKANAGVAKPAEAQLVFCGCLGHPFGFKKSFPFRSCCRGPPQFARMSTWAQLPVRGANKRVTRTAKHADEAH